MLRLICASALAGLLAVAPASSQTVLVLDRQLLVGKYHFEEAGLKVDVDLNADRTAVYTIGASLSIGAPHSYPGVTEATLPDIEYVSGPNSARRSLLINHTAPEGNHPSGGADNRQREAAHVQHHIPASDDRKREANRVDETQRCQEGSPTAYGPRLVSC